MSYEDVYDIFGFEGKGQSKASLGGATTVMYQRQDGNGPIVVVAFENDKLVGKSQFGL
ncbi:MAG: hypothetical protein KGJ59_08645 [Bacteroidota bacterium]|nr:hypothetical protein [Bacteroidota bacterium]